MSRAVTFDRFGPTDNLRISEVEPPHPGAGEVRVRVRATGLNPVDWKIISDPSIAEAYGIGAFPSGNGNDFAGEIDEVGDGVDHERLGQGVFGGRRFFAQADFVVVAAEEAHPIPAGLSFDQAGSLAIVGRTAVASVRAVAPQPGETVLVSAAAGGVGVLATQLAIEAGAAVVATAGEANHAFLRSLGATPVSYGDGLADRVREAAPDGIQAVLDNHGADTLLLAEELGVPGERINTIADRETAARVGAMTVGGRDAEPEDLPRLAERIGAGEIAFPIDSVFPVERVREAYTHLRNGHLQGKVVLGFE